jgi:hypothetical protein
MIPDLIHPTEVCCTNKTPSQRLLSDSYFIYTGFCHYKGIFEQGYNMHGNKSAKSIKEVLTILLRVMVGRVKSGLLRL